MKIKTDFVTNSSSASFYMYISTDDTSLSAFIERINKMFVNLYYKPLDITDEHVTKISIGMFRIEDFTSMYNSNEDIPDYMRTILLEWYLTKGNLLKHGIKDVYFEVDDDGF